MPPITEEQMQALAPYVAGAGPDQRGEVEIYCPLHNDSRRSASINLHMGVWYCHAGCGGGSIRQLVLNDDGWVPAEGRVQEAPRGAQNAVQALRMPTKGDVQHWHRRLRREHGMRYRLYRQRGLKEPILRRARIGWDGRHYRIPIFSPRGRLWNVKTYDMDPMPGRRKMWNTKGMGKARLYPSSVVQRLNGKEPVLFCEGEWDTLLALQHGFTAVTRTDGAGKAWHDVWTDQFAGLCVYICHDCDRTGASSDDMVADALSDVADVRQVWLPFEETESSGLDLSDYLLLFNYNDRTDVIQELLDDATVVSP